MKTVVDFNILNGLTLLEIAEFDVYIFYENRDLGHFFFFFSFCSLRLSISRHCQAQTYSVKLTEFKCKRRSALSLNENQYAMSVLHGQELVLNNNTQSF